MQKKQQIRNSTAEFLIFAMQGDAEGIEVRLEDDTVWLTQQMLAELYGTTKQNISLHILNIYEEEELSRESTVKDFLTVRNEGNRKVNRRLEYYNLDIIIAVGYRVNSKRATQFRQWATAVLRDFAIRDYGKCRPDGLRVCGGGGALYFCRILVCVIRDCKIKELPGSIFVVRIHLNGTIVIETGRISSVDISSHLLTSITPGEGFLGDTPLHYALKAQQGGLSRNSPRNKIETRSVIWSERSKRKNMHDYRCMTTPL